MTDRPRHAHYNMTTMALVVESTLTLAALLLGWLLGMLPLTGTNVFERTFSQHLWDVALGIAATIPLLCLLPLVERIPWGPLIRLNQVVNESLVPLFAGTKLWQLAVISLAAGVGEEVFFRAFLQAAVADWTFVWIGLLVASAIFGICHCVTPTYAVLATVIGFYLGLLFIFSGSLVAPIVAHALYDFLALIYLVRVKPPRAPAAPDEAPVEQGL